MPPELTRTWDAITSWLDRHAPAQRALIRPPAGDEEVRAAGQALGVPLPADLVAWWRLADGQSGHGQLLPPYYSPHPVRHALANRDVMLTAWNSGAAADPVLLAEADRAPAGTPCHLAWLPSWLPVAGTGGGDQLFVDLRPGPAHGCVREFHNQGGASDEARWPGVAAMLADVAAGLTGGVAVRGCQVWTEDDGTISWDLPLRRWSAGGSRPVNLDRLRAGYATLVGELRTGGFGPPAAGAWSAERIAAHAVRNTELLLATTRALVAGGPVAGPVRYDNADAMRPATLDGYTTAGVPVLADRVERLAGELYPFVPLLNRGRPMAHVRVVDGGEVLLDEAQGWLGVLNALWVRQLPLRTRQLRALR